MRRLFDRLLSADTMDAVAPTSREDRAYLFSYCARPDASAPFLRFYVTHAETDLLAFLGAPVAPFEVLQARQAGFQFHWRSDLVRAYEEQAAILGTSCAFAYQGELLIEHLAVPSIERHRVREIRGWIGLGRDLADDLRGPDSLQAIRRPLRSRHVKLPHRLLRRLETGSSLTLGWSAQGSGRCQGPAPEAGLAPGLRRAGFAVVPRETDDRLA